MKCTLSPRQALRPTGTLPDRRAFGMIGRNRVGVRPGYFYASGLCVCGFLLVLIVFVPGKKGLGGRSARLVVTMGMPAIVYRWYFRASGVKSLERNILGFVGIEPVRETLIGGVDRLGADGVADWKARLDRLGAVAE